MPELWIDERLLVAMTAKHCSECGAELKLGPARCPLCGTEANQDADWSKEKPASTENYQHNVRNLRAQLKKLRDEAEAV